MALVFIDQEPDGIEPASRRRAGGKSLYSVDLYQGSPEEKAYEEMPYNRGPSTKLDPRDLIIRPEVPEPERIKVKGGNPWDYERWQKHMMIRPDSPFPIL